MSSAEPAAPAAPPALARAREALREAAPHLLALAGLAALVALAYGNALRGAFVFDDLTHLRGDALVRDLSHFAPGGLAWRQRSSRILAYLTFALNHRLGEYDPWGYHLFNVVVHALNAGLVYALVALAFRTPRLRGSALAPWAGAVAFAAAALFATHPLQTQAVTYVVQRVTSLAALFYLGAVAAWARWRIVREAGGRGRRWYVLALAAALLAVKTKEIAFTLPAAVALWELTFHGPGGALRRLRPALPIAALALLVPLSVLRLSGDRPLGERVEAATRLQTQVSRHDYLVSQAPVVTRYLGLLAWPAGQTIDHDVPLETSWRAPRVLRALAVLAALCALSALLYAGTARGRLDPAWRLVAFGVPWFLVALAVESSVVPILDLLYEHRAYLPAAGVLAAAATAGALALRRLAPAHPARAITLGAVALALLYAGLTLRRNAVWSNEATLWLDAVEKSPGKARPHLNLGGAFLAAGRPREAIPELERGLALAPGSAYAHGQLGAALLATGRVPEAQAHLRAALEGDPRDWESMFNLAFSLWRGGQRDEARAWFSRFVEQAPATAAYAGARRYAAARLQAP